MSAKDVGRDKGDNERTDVHTFVCIKRNENRHLGRGLVHPEQSISIYDRRRFSDKMSNIVLRSRWCEVVVL